MGLATSAGLGSKSHWCRQRKREHGQHHNVMDLFHLLATTTDLICEGFLN
jgi:hypothetical protein